MRDHVSLMVPRFQMDENQVRGQKQHNYEMDEPLKLIFHKGAFQEFRFVQQWKEFKWIDSPPKTVQFYIPLSSMSWSDIPQVQKYCQTVGPSDQVVVDFTDWFSRHSHYPFMKCFLIGYSLYFSMKFYGNPLYGKKVCSEINDVFGVIFPLMENLYDIAIPRWIVGDRKTISQKDLTKLNNLLESCQNIATDLGNGHQAVRNNVGYVPLHKHLSTIATMLS